jgi:hypothetical protein
MIRDIVGQPNTEALYDLKSEELQFFKVSGITKN